MIRSSSPAAAMALIVCFALGCTKESSEQKSADPEKSQAAAGPMRETVESQRAVFYVKMDTVGGPGAGDVYREPHMRGKARVDGKPILLTFESVEMIKRKAPRKSSIGMNDYVRVNARFRIEKSSGSVSSNPPSHQSYSGLVVEELFEADNFTASN